MTPQTYEHYKIKKKLGVALRRYVLTDNPCKRLQRYIGLDQPTFQAYIAAQLRPGMTLSNYGKMWVLDHIVPLFLFDHSSDSDLKIGWNYANVIPMPPMLNRLKGVSVDFSQKELARRAKFFTANPNIALLQERMDTFHTWMCQLASSNLQLREVAKVLKNRSCS